MNGFSEQIFYPGKTTRVANLNAVSVKHHIECMAIDFAKAFSNV